MQKISIVLLYALLLSLHLHAQTDCDKTLQGTVKDLGGHILPGVIVMIPSLNKGVTTDEQGKFIFHDICQGKYEITIGSMGFKAVTLTVDVTRQNRIDVSLSEEVHELNEIEIQSEIQQTEHAHNYSTLHEQKLSETAGKPLGEMLKDITGVNTIQAGPGIFKPVIHGVHSQRVLILNHGIRQEGQQWGAEHAPEIDPFIASDITVIKDASSIKYGSDALGGVIVVNPPTLPESNIVGGKIQTVAQTNGRSATISGMLEGGIKDTPGWGWRVQATGKRTGDFQAPDYQLTNTGVKELNFSASTGYRGSDYGFEIYFSHFDTEIGILKGTAVESLEDLMAAMNRETPLYTGGFSYSIGEPRQEVSHNLLKANGHINTQRGAWRMQYGFQNNNRKEFNIRKGSRSNLPSIDLQLNTHTIEAEYEESNSPSRSFCIGITGMAQDNNNIPGTQRIPFVPNFVNVAGGGFIVLKRAVGKWMWDFGVRYDYRNISVKGFDFRNERYQSKYDFHNASATTGATIKLKNNASFSTSLSSAWRPPHVVELFSFGLHQSAASNEYGLLLDAETNEVLNIEDVKFRVEQAVKWVSTLRKDWKKVSVEATGYANYVFNYIYLRPVGVTQTISGPRPAFRYSQTEALFIGADLSAEIQLTDNLQLQSKASLIHASDESNDDFLIFIPANRYKALLRYQHPGPVNKRRFYTEVSAEFTDKQRRAPRVVTIDQLFSEENNSQVAGKNFDFMEAPASYLLADISFGITFPGDKATWDLRASCENIFNTQYRDYTNRLRYYADDIGRNFSLSLRFIF
ncbi:MAG TPA: TonB-dependent receptor [Chryseosolibacter sp.]|nr:TonB-dependent receptor [Chryseosolibacter sp.]